MGASSVLRPPPPPRFILTYYWKGRTQGSDLLVGTKTRGVKDSRSLAKATFAGGRRSCSCEQTIFRHRKEIVEEASERKAEVGDQISRLRSSSQHLSYCPHNILTFRSTLCAFLDILALLSIDRSLKPRSFLRPVPKVQQSDLISAYHLDTPHRSQSHPHHGGCRKCHRRLCASPCSTLDYAK
jgi:hypothetical protein